MVSCLCESGFSVKMAGPGICVLCLEDTCTSEVQPVSNLLHLMDICFLTCITNPDFLIKSCRTCLCEQQRQPSNGFA